MSSRPKLMAVSVLMIMITTICSGQGPAQGPARGPARTAGIDPALMAKANAGNAEAEFLVGTKYELGAQVPKDPAQAAAWYRKAADKRYPQAEHSLGILYEFGTGVPVD